MLLLTLNAVIVIINPDDASDDLQRRCLHYGWVTGSGAHLRKRAKAGTMCGLRPMMQSSFSIVPRALASPANAVMA